jgi:hypothetical protein
MQVLDKVKKRPRFMTNSARREKLALQSGGQTAQVPELRGVNKVTIYRILGFENGR